MSEVEWRGRTVPVKIDKARIFLLGLADNEAAIAQVSLFIHPHPFTSGVWIDAVPYTPGRRQPSLNSLLRASESCPKA